MTAEDASGGWRAEYAAQSCPPPDADECPSCGAPVRVEGGCPSCVACEWSKCGGGRGVR